MVLCSEAEKCQSVETAGPVMVGNSNGEIVGIWENSLKTFLYLFL